jgi:hypothetical protein
MTGASSSTEVGQSWTLSDVDVASGLPLKQPKSRADVFTRARTLLSHPELSENMAMTAWSKSHRPANNLPLTLGPGVAHAAELGLYPLLAPACLRRAEQTGVTKPNPTGYWLSVQQHLPV